MSGLSFYRSFELDEWDGSDANEVSIFVDHPDWTVPKKITGGFTVGGGISNTHIEAERKTNLTSANINIEFETAFNSIPVGIDNIKAYKMTNIGGSYAIENILIKFSTSSPVSTTGFTCILDTEDLTGVIFEYEFKEA